MSHSQFHSIKLFTLRHAWLNLWDKHMTTGRINQITIVQRKTNPLFNQSKSPSIIKRPKSRGVVFEQFKIIIWIGWIRATESLFWIRSSRSVPTGKLQGTSGLKPKFATSWWAFLSAKQSKQLGSEQRFRLTESCGMLQQKGWVSMRDSRWGFKSLRIPQWLPTRLVSLLSFAIGNRCKSSLVTWTKVAMTVQASEFLVMSAS